MRLNKDSAQVSPSAQAGGQVCDREASMNGSALFTLRKA